MEISDFTGEDLLELFDTLDIELGNLNPNVIKAWFDTDCKDTKDCLKWMCASITNANLLSAQETIESSELETLIVGNKYDSSLAATEEKFPGIFDDPAEIQFEIELLEDENQIYSEELDELEYIISVNEKIREKACSDLHKLTNEEISAKLRLEKAKEECECLSRELDNIDIQLHEQIIRYGGYLSDFELAAVPHFIHNMPVYACEDNFLMMSGYLNTFLKQEYAEISVSVTNKSVYSENSPENLFDEKICIMKNRIFNAWQKYLMEKFRVEELKAVIFLLSTYNVNYSTLLMDRAQIEMCLEAEMEQKSIMLGMIENICMKHAEYQVSEPNLRFAQKELEIQNVKLGNSKQLLEYITKLLATYNIINMLFVQEHVDIVSLDEFFKEVVKYITKDLQMCILRTEAMSHLIGEFKLYNAMPIVQKLKIVDEIMQHVTDKKGDESADDITLMKAVSFMNELKNQVISAEEHVYFKGFDLHREHTKQIKEQINVLNNFLMSGPTSRVVAVPLELFNIFREIDLLTHHQNAAVKSVVDIIGVTSKTLAQKKWLNNRRHLWMHFLNDHAKLLTVLKSIEDEYNSLKITT